MRLLADMESFVEVAKARNFGRAAIVLKTTASTLSRRIAQLEKELGVILIRRTTRSFALTEAGEKLYRQSQKLVAEAARAREELTADFTEVAGHLKIGLPADLAITLLAPVFTKFCREHPAVSLSITATTNQPDLNRDTLDLAFAVAHQVSLQQSTFVARHIGSFSRQMYASRNYLKRKGTPSAPQQLEDHECIRYVDVSPETEWEVRQGKSHRTVAVNGICASNSIIVAAQAARGHLGIAMLPHYMASHPTFGAGLSRVLSDWEGTPAIVFAVTADRILPAKTAELIRVAQAEFSKQLAQMEAVGNRERLTGR